MSSTTKLTVICTEADGGGSLLVAVCESDAVAHEMLARIPTQYSRDFYLDEATLNTPMPEYAFYFPTAAS